MIRPNAVAAALERADQQLALAVSNLARVSRSGATPATAATFATAHHCNSATFGVNPTLGGDLHEPPVELGVDPRRDLAEPLTATRQELRSLPARGRR